MNMLIIQTRIVFKKNSLSLSLSLSLSVTDSPKTMVLRVFKALGIPELAVDVLSVRSLTRNDVSVVGDHQRRHSVVLRCLLS